MSEQRPRTQDRDLKGSVLMPRLGFHDERLTEVAEGREINPTSAPLAFMWFNGQLALFGGQGPRKVVALDPETHHRTLPRKARTPNFRRLPYGNAPAYQPDRDRLTAPAIRQLIDEVLGAQRQHHATLLITPSHLAGACGSLGRDQELLITEASTRVFAAEHMQEPPAGREVARELYIAVTVSIATLRDPVARARLAQAYAALDGEGFWVQILGFHERAVSADAQAGAAFLFELWARSARPVISSRPGNLALSLLAAGLPAVELGISENERFGFARKRDPADQSGRTRAIWHPELFKSYRPDRQPDRDTAARAFAALGCSCGQHPPHERPDGSQTKPHTLLCRLGDAAQLGTGALSERRRQLLEALSSAAEAAQWANVEAVDPEPLYAVLRGADEARADAGKPVASSS